MSILSVSTNRAAALVNPYAYQNTTDKTSGNTNTAAGLSGVLSSNSEGDTYQMTPIPPASMTYSSTGTDYDTSAEDSVASTLASAAKLYNNLDTDGDGSVSPAEFVAARPDDVTEEMATQLYSSLDADSSGALSASEIAAVLNNTLSSTATVQALPDMTTAGIDRVAKV